jgi:hypothetical protein
MIKRDLQEVLEKRQECRNEPVRAYVNTKHVDVGTDFSDAQVAEIFLHHRLLLIPVAEDGRVVGVITRAGFFRSVAERFPSQRAPAANIHGLACREVWSAIEPTVTPSNRHPGQRHRRPAASVRPGGG